MNEDQKKKIALFRFGVISSLVGARNQGWGYQKKLLREICEKQWEIPGSGRSNISKSTIFNWLSRYEKNGNSLDALMPSSRKDIGISRKLDKETVLALVNMKRENPKASLSVLIDIARTKGVIPSNLGISKAAIYRIIKKHMSADTTPGKDRRKFEAELPNDLWQADCMHGPYVVSDGKKRKAFLFGIIDDHSRLITHAQFFLKENLGSFLECLKKALAKRGLPRKLYVDNGPYFKAHKLEYSLASLGTALLHAKPYTPEGKGKIERWFRTIRMCFLPRVPAGVTLEKLNELLEEWVDGYHERKHSSTNRPPLKRYLEGIHLIRQAPDDIETYFRTRACRRVNKDRTLSLKSRLFEAPVGLVGKKIEVVFNESDPLDVEAYFNGESWGKLTLLDQQINSKVFRDDYEPRNKEQKIMPEPLPGIQAGKLFESGEKDD
jgi:transposase InsO family protein